MGLTKKPCPGCGVEGKRQKDKVCWRCARALEARRKEDMRNEWLESTEEYGVPAKREGWPIRWTGRYYATEEFRKTIAVMFLDCLPPVSVTDSAGNVYGGGPIVDNGDVYHYLPAHSHGWFQGRRVTPTGAASIRAFHESLQEELTACYNAGVEAGRDLLTQVARGELSLTDFNAVKGKCE